MNRAIIRAATLVAALSISSLAGADPPRPISTRDFVQAAAASDRFETLEAQLARVEGRDPRVQAFAGEMITAHAETTRTLRQATASAGLPPPPEGLTGDQAMLLSALQGQRGRDFDKTYARHQVLGHTQALAVEEDYLSTGGDAAVKRAAAASIPIIRHHLEEARHLCSALQCDS